MLQNSADVPACSLGQVGIRALAEEQRLLGFPEALMHVHAAAVVVKHRFGHERGGFAVSLGHVANNVFVGHGVVRSLNQLCVFHAQFVLSSTSHFVVVLFDGDPQLGH